MINKLKIVIVTNIPAPYRMEIYKILSEKLGYEHFHVVFCAEKEANREWIFEKNNFAHTFLKQNYFKGPRDYMHINYDVLGVLRKLDADIVITTGFNPTHLLAFAYALAHGKTHIPMTDGTWASEQILTVLHRIVRRVVYRFSKAFIGASLGSLQLFKSYGISEENLFQSHLCANNAAFQPVPGQRRPYDLMFSGRFAPVKNPFFAVDVAVGVARKLERKISLLMLGSGELLEEVKSYAQAYAEFVDVSFPGFLQQAELPDVYCSAKLFLFPTQWDPWGVVANEACAAGQAVLVSPHAGAANDLIIHGENGYVLELDLESWVEHAAALLGNEDLLLKFSTQSLSKVQSYSYQAAADGILAAVCAVSR